MNNQWFQTFNVSNTRPSVENPIKLFTFHHAGGASQYFKPWSEKLPPWIELVSVQLPGRWNRSNEQHFLRMEDLIASLGKEFKELIQKNHNQKFAFYGHSLGGLIAYELTKYLILSGEKPPVHLFISSKRALQDSGHIFPIYDLPMDKFEFMLATLYGALPPEVAADSDMKAMFLDITKKDMELLETYVYMPGPKINVPLTILGGTEDRLITLDTLQGWINLTTANCEILQLPGDHFFIRTSENELLKKIEDSLKVFN